MVDWVAHGSPLKPTDFEWSSGAAWAGHMIEKGGKFYWYLPMDHRTVYGKAIGVAVGDTPLGPFKDARGTALMANDMTTDANISWDDIDPAAASGVRSASIICITMRTGPCRRSSRHRKE